METTFKLRTATAFTNTVLETGHKNADFPTVKQTSSVEITTPDVGQGAQAAYTIDDVTVMDDIVDPSIKAPFEREVSRSKGTRGTWRVSQSGAISDVTISPPGGAHQSQGRISTLTDAIRQSSVVFPDSDIGIGATWQETSDQTYSGVKWHRTVKYRLKDVSETTATVLAEVDMTAASQALSVEPNATTKLTSAKSNSTVELVVPLKSLVSEGTANGTSEANFLIVRGHLRITSTIQSETVFSVKPMDTTSETPR